MLRREILEFAAAALLHADASATVKAALGAAAVKSPDELAADERFWSSVRRAFTIDPNIINLNTGGVSSSPRAVQQAVKRLMDLSEMGPVHYMWSVLGPEVETVRRRVASVFGCDPEEIAIMRNASEALETAQLGLALKPGEEVITTYQDYPRMIQTWKQRGRRDGIALKLIDFPNPPPSLDDLTGRFERAITPRTRVLHFCHVTNRTGQLFPVKQICAMARARGLQTIVDGAQAFGQIPFQRDDLDCDYYGASFHKWINGPIGTGFLYVRRERIRKLWPLMAAPEAMTDNIRKFEEIGTHPAAQVNAVADALDFHEELGTERKLARLDYLRRYWSHRLARLPAVKLLHSEDPKQHCAIGFFHVSGADHGKLAAHLWDKHRIIVHPSVAGNGVAGLRITPNIYTSLDDVEVFTAATEKEIRSGIA